MLYKEISCPICNGYGFTSEISDCSIGARVCDNCLGNGTLVVPMTNGDIIRTCNNEQLVTVFFNLEKWAIYSGGNNNRLLFKDNAEDFLLWMNKDADDIDLNTIFNFINKENFEHPLLKVERL